MRKIFWEVSFNMHVGGICSGKFESLFQATEFIRLLELTNIASGFYNLRKVVE